MIAILCLISVKYKNSNRFKMKSTNIILVAMTGKKEFHQILYVFQFENIIILPENLPLNRLLTKGSNSFRTHSVSGIDFYLYLTWANTVNCILQNIWTCYFRKLFCSWITLQKDWACLIVWLLSDFVIKFLHLVNFLWVQIIVKYVTVLLLPVCKEVLSRCPILFLPGEVKLDQFKLKACVLKLCYNLTPIQEWHIVLNKHLVLLKSFFNVCFLDPFILKKKKIIVEYFYHFSVKNYQHII